MVNLFLMRHSIAIAYVGSGGDNERALTPEGIAVAQHMAQLLGLWTVRLQQIWTSPARRTKQTAHVLMQHSTSAVDVVLKSTPSLALDATLADLLRELKQWALEGSTLLLISHQPCLQALASQLLSENKQAVQLQFEPAAIAWLQVSRGLTASQASLRSLIQPRELHHSFDPRNR